MVFVLALDVGDMALQLIAVSDEYVFVEERVQLGCFHRCGGKGGEGSGGLRDPLHEYFK